MVFTFGRSLVASGVHQNKLGVGEIRARLKGATSARSPKPRRWGRPLPLRCHGPDLLGVLGFVQSLMILASLLNSYGRTA